MRECCKQSELMDSAAAASMSTVMAVKTEPVFKEDLHVTKGKGSDKAMSTTSTCPDQLDCRRRRRRRDRSYTEIQAILQQFDALPPSTTIRQASRSLGVTYATLHKWLSNRSSQSRPCRSDRKRRRVGLCPQVEMALIKWIKLVNIDRPLTGPLLKRKGKELAAKLGIENFRGSDGWLERFKKRNNISTNESSNKTSNELQSGCNGMNHSNWDACWTAIREEYEVTEIWSGLETRLQTRELINLDNNDLNNGNSDEELNKSIVREEHSVLVVFLCCSMGGQKKELYMSPSAKTKLKSNLSLPTTVSSTSTSFNGRMTSMNFREWLNNWNAELLANQERAVLLLRRTLAHADDLVLSNVRVQLLPDAISSPIEIGVHHELLSGFRGHLDLSTNSYYHSPHRANDRLWALQRAWEDVNENSVQSSWLQFSKDGIVSSSYPLQVLRCKKDNVVTEDDIVQDVQQHFHTRTTLHIKDHDHAKSDHFEGEGDRGLGHVVKYGMCYERRLTGHTSRSTSSASHLNDVPSMQDMLEASRIIREGLLQRGFDHVRLLDKIDEEIKSACCYSILHSSTDG